MKAKKTIARLLGLLAFAAMFLGTGCRPDGGPIIAWTVGCLIVAACAGLLASMIHDFSDTFQPEDDRDDDEGED